MNKTKITHLLKYTKMYEEALRRHDELLIIKKKTEENLIKSRQGRLRISTSDRQPQFYIKNEKSDRCWKYISKKGAEYVILTVL